MRHSAAAPHPPFITYDAVGTLVQDGSRTHVEQAVAYRDDGMALVVDDRFERPYVTKTVDPGPPELGPYAGRRSMWLLPEEMDPTLRVIAKVNTTNRLPCTNVGTVHYHDRDTYDLVFGSALLHRTGLQEMLVDIKTAEIWKVVLRAYEDPLDPASATQAVPVDYNIELEQLGPYAVVDHITWNYEVKHYSQWSTVSGDYYYKDFRFPSSLPDTYFEL